MHINALGKTSPSKPVVPPGQPVTFWVQYRVSVPPRHNAPRARVRGHLFFHQQPLARESWPDLVLREGTHTFTFPYPIPEQAAAGMYTMRITVTPPRRKGVTADIAFEVQRAPP